MPLPQAKSYEQEQREHEQAVSLAALARSVLALASSAAAAAAAASGAVGRGGVTRAMVEAGGSKKARAGAAAAAVVAGTTADRGVGAAGAEGVEIDGGADRPLDETEPEGAEVVVAAATAAAAGSVSSQEKLYLEAMQEQQFATMQMEVALPSTNGGASAGEPAVWRYPVGIKPCGVVTRVRLPVYRTAVRRVGAEYCRDGPSGLGAVFGQKYGASDTFLVSVLVAAGQAAQCLCR